MTNGEMISAIYENIANKALSFGCKIILNGEKTLHYYNGALLYTVNFGLERPFKSIDIEKIIGHPIMIGDVLDYWDNNFNICNEKFEKIIKLWNEKRKPIEDQSDKCIEYVYNLIKK